MPNIVGGETTLSTKVTKVHEGRAAPFLSIFQLRPPSLGLFMRWPIEWRILRRDALECQGFCLPLSSLEQRKVLHESRDATVGIPILRED